MKIGNSSRENNHNSHGLFAERDQDDQLKGRSHGRSQSRKPGYCRKSKQRGNCNYCHKLGHGVRDCPSLKNKDKNKAESLAVATEQDTGFSATITAPQGDKRWVLDTGASYHMTLFWDCFTTFEEFEGETFSSDACVAHSLRNLDATCLWHLRLGHTLENNLEILRKWKLIAVDTPTTLHTVVHIVNQLPCSSIAGKIPEEIWRDGIKGYRIRNPVTRKVIHSRRVTFHESIMFKSNHNRQPTPKPEIICYVSPPPDGDEIIVSPLVPNSSARGFTLGSESEEDVSPPDTSTSDRLEYVLHIIQDESFQYSEALASSHCDKWLGVMHEEMEAISKNNTWELCPLPKVNRAIGCKWVYKVKDNKRYKARLVAKGFA
ncbi:hypothetical protein L6452_33141 [Arctium lappa]|uniref:Uncharacterized protein n=1 Tax=Arctium lappa TaxID=4217 RepID=A0ACB8Z5M0_ARCLA|nr:hypothetical protein L6452_33141 [Arctium lappa]